MENSSTDLVIDWQLGKQLMGNDLEAAKSLMAMLVEDLPKTWDKLATAYQGKELEAARQIAHGLHGAVCYCGTPRLKVAVKQFEYAIRHTQPADEIEALYQKLEKEIQAVIEAYAKEVE